MRKNLLSNELDNSKFWNSKSGVFFPKILNVIGISLLTVYAVFHVASPSVGSLSETVMALLGLLSLLIWGEWLRKSAALWLLLSAILVQILSWVIGVNHHPQWVESNPQIDRLAKLFIFISVAWWLGGNTNRTLVIWSLSFFGFLFSLFANSEVIEDWFNGLSGYRVDFGIRNAQHAAMYFGTGLLGLLAFARRMLGSGRGWLLRRLAWLSAFVICSAGVVVTQTRAIWLALFIVLPVMLALFVWWHAYHYNCKKTCASLLVVSLCSVLIVMPVIYTGYDEVFLRLKKESYVITNVLTGQFSDIPYSSVGTRFHTWRAAKEWIAERPLVGWGGKGRSLVTDHTGWLPQKVKENYGHLHNYFLELWVAYGLLGVGVFVSLAFWIGRGTWLAWRGGVMPNDIALFGVSFFIYWVIINQFESYNSFWTGVFVHNLVVGGLVTHYWRWQLTGARDDDAQPQNPSSK